MIGKVLCIYKGGWIVKQKIKIFFAVILIIFLVGCKQDKATPTYSNQSYLIKPGDILVVNMTSDSLLHFDSNGVSKGVLYDVDNVGESLYGIAWKADTKEIIFTVNGSPRVGAISVVDGTYRNLITDTNLSGTLRGLTQLPGGDILVIETANVERFSSTGVRKTSVAGVTWPNTFGGTAAPEQIYTTANGELILCGSANVNRFTDKAVRVGAAVVSAIAGTTAATGCIEMRNGSIAVAFNGTTDTIRSVGAGMTQASIGTIYSDLAVLGSPRYLTQTLNGNLLTVDSVFNQIVEVTSSGAFVRTLGGSILGTPNAVFSVPNY